MIRLGALLLTTFSLLAWSASDQPVRPTPVVRTINPPTAKVGDQLVAKGDNLSKEFVFEVYLTQGDNTFKADIKTQTAETITFVVPETVKAGRFGFMILTRGPSPVLLDEPASVTIE